MQFRYGYRYKAITLTQLAFRGLWLIFKVTYVKWSVILCPSGWKITQIDLEKNLAASVLVGRVTNSDSIGFAGK